MDKKKARADLERMHADLGDWIYGCTAHKARQRAADYRSDAEDIDRKNWDSPIDSARAMRLRAKALLLEHVATCVEKLGSEMLMPPMEELPAGVVRFTPKGGPKDNIVFHGSDETDMEIDSDDMESFTMKEIKDAPLPQFKLGDSAWMVTDMEEEGIEAGFIEVIICGVDHSVEDTFYIVGYLDDDGDLVRTNYECIGSQLILADPDHYDGDRPVKKTKEQMRAHLSVVR